MFSDKDQMILLYSFNEHNVYCGSFKYFWAEGTGFAANSTNIAPPDFQHGFTTVFDEVTQTWSIIEDHRGEKVYSTDNKTEQIIDYVGPIKAGFTKLKPSSQVYEWNGTEWLDTRTPEEIAAYERSIMPNLSPIEFEIKLYKAGLYDTVKNYIDNEASVPVRIAYNRAIFFSRTDPFIVTAMKDLKLTDEQVDAVWIGV